jgi:hypothetical protein
MTMKHTTKNNSKEDSGNTKHSKLLDVQQGSSKSNEDETNGIKRKRDEEITACFEAAKQKIGRLLTSKKQVIKDLACELERLGRPVEQMITVGNNGQQTIYNEHDTQELKEPADTPAESVTSNQQSNQANLQKSAWNPDPKTGTESLSPEQITTEQSAETNTSAPEPGPMRASPIDTHVAEDSMSSGSMDKSACENCSAGDIRIKKLEDENRELRIRCQWAESNNTKLVLQLTRQGRYINELLGQDQNAIISNNFEERISLINQPEETPADKDVTSYTDEIELTILKEKYPSLEEAMQKSRDSVSVVFDKEGMLKHAIPDIYKGK